jgi:hypothetical protein
MRRLSNNQGQQRPDLSKNSRSAQNPHCDFHFALKGGQIMQFQITATACVGVCVRVATLKFTAVFATNVPT